LIAPVLISGSASAQILENATRPSASWACNRGYYPFFEREEGAFNTGPEIRKPFWNNG